MDEAPMVDVVELSDEAWAEMRENAAQRHLGCSAAEFVERWNSGEYHMGHDHDDHLAIAMVWGVFPELD